MIKLSGNYSVSHKNGYYLTHQSHTSEKGEKSFKEAKTYPTMLMAWEALKEAGECGSSALAAMEQARVEFCKKKPTPKHLKKGGENE